MDSHPNYALLEPYLTGAPAYAGPLFISHNDLTLSQKWHKVEVHMLESPELEAEGRRRPFMMAWRKTEERPRCVFPVALSDELSPKWFRTHFAALVTHPAYLANDLPIPSPPSNPPPGVEGEQDPPVLYTAIVGRDSSVVYYRIAKGIEKPHDVPE